MRALVWQGGDKVEVADVAPPQRSPGRGLVEPAYVGLCGTDVHICRGEHPRARPGLIIGHEIVGRLAESAGHLEVGSPVLVNPLLPCGSCVACRRGRAQVCERLRLIGIDEQGGAAELLSVPVGQLVPLPSALDLRWAALLEPLSVAVRALRRGGVRFGDRVHVVGAGPVGLLVAGCARLSGAALVTVSEPVHLRAQRAASLGFALGDPSAPDGAADVVFDCTGHPSVSASVLQWAASGGAVVIVGAYPGLVEVDLQEVMFRELTIVGTRVYTSDDVGAAIELIAAERLDVSPLVTAVVPLDEGPAAIQRLRACTELKVLLARTAA